MTYCKDKFTTTVIHKSPDRGPLPKTSENPIIKCHTLAISVATTSPASCLERRIESRPLSNFGAMIPENAKVDCKVRPISYYRQTFPTGKTCPASSPDRAHRSIYPDSFEPREEPLRKLCGIRRPSPMPAAPHTQSI